MHISQRVIVSSSLHWASSMNQWSPKEVNFFNRLLFKFFMFLRLSGMAKIFYTGSFRSWEVLDCLQISCYFLQNMNTSQLCKYNIGVGRMISRKYMLTEYLFVFSDLEFF